jgi:hypothetical protein
MGADASGVARGRLVVPDDMQAQRRKGAKGARKKNGKLGFAPFAILASLPLREAATAAAQIEAERRATQ